MSNPQNPQFVNVPSSEFEKMTAVPLQLAQMEAAQMIARGDVAGANARIAQGVAQSAALHAQASRISRPPRRRPRRCLRPRGPPARL